MRRRLDLAMALVGEPRVVLLDEPTTGLDPGSRRTVWRIVRQHVADGVTVLVTTPCPREADALADRVAVLADGRIVAERPGNAGTGRRAGRAPDGEETAP